MSKKQTKKKISTSDSFCLITSHCKAYSQISCSGHSEKNEYFVSSSLLTAQNWENLEIILPPCHCHNFHRVEAVCLNIFNCTFKFPFFVSV